MNNEDALSTHSTDTDETIAPDTTYKPLTEEEIKELQKLYDPSRLWYAEYIKDGECTLSQEEFDKEFKKRFVYPKIPRD